MRARVGDAVRARLPFGLLPAADNAGDLFAAREDFGTLWGRPSTAGTSADHSLITARRLVS